MKEASLMKSAVVCDPLREHSFAAIFKSEFVEKCDWNFSQPYKREARIQYKEYFALPF